MAKFGWNTKGTLSVPILESFSEWLQGQDIKETWLRVQGGTISQKDYNSDWKDSDVEAWGDLYAGNPTVKLVFVVNLNETPENIEVLFNRFLAVGCKFAFIEFGNEQYLSKFRLSKDKPEVTDRTKDMTAEKYLELCAQYVPSFAGRDLAFQLAPNKGKNVDQVYDAWNSTILEATNHIPEINYTMHVYANAGFRWELIEEVQEVIKGKFLAITEFGAADAADGEQDELTEEEFIEMTEDVAKILSEELREQDIAFDQVLWNPWGVPSISFENGNLTTKGLAVFEQFKIEEEPEVPEVVEVVLETYSTNYDRTFWGAIKVTQALKFSDGTIIYNTAKVTRRGTVRGRIIGTADIGKTIEELKG